MGSEKKSDGAARRGGKPLPVSTLCGFLGAGKTTLLRHILHTKHEEDGKQFKCAVIVNDMAELNIDKSLVDRTALVQSDKVIAMQNGCVCCTLQDDLVDQIVELAKGDFDYMILEASGVSEPAEIARLFAPCEEEHDHGDHSKDGDQLHEMATLDTCVTVVDCADFFSNLETVKQAENDKSLARLLTEQVMCANVVLLNKTDLVNKEQLAKVEDCVRVLNPSAKIIHTRQSKVDVKAVLFTGAFDAVALGLTAGPEPVVEEPAAEESCCAGGSKPCCKRSRTRDSGKSQVIFPKTAGPKTRHQERFGVSSFLFKARRPFHPRRFFEQFVDKYFVSIDDSDDEDDSDSDDDDDDDDEKKDKKDAGNNDEGKGEASDRPAKMAKREDGMEVDDDDDAESVSSEVRLQRMQEEAATKQAMRTKALGTLCRSKGFLWMSNSHDVMGAFNQAGNVVTLEVAGPWNAVHPKAWVGSEEQKARFRKEWVGEWADRRQDLVFIGMNLNSAKIQEVLDECLLTDDEMALGVDGWKATMGDVFLQSEGAYGDEEDEKEEA